MRRLCVALGMLALAVTTAAAQTGFRVAHRVANTTPTHVEVAGSVHNEARAEAVDVSVTVEAVGPGGKVLARGITFVTSRLPEHASASFTAKIPAVSGVTGYRATVSSYRFVPGLQRIEGP
jgi:hypothetical protein